MGTYIGCIEKKGYEPAIYFNFKPLFEISGKAIIYLSSEDRNELLPDSEKENINFSYNYNYIDQRDFMEKHFSPDQLVVFEFELSDLLDNTSRGERKPTGYKVITTEMWDYEKIRYLGSEGISMLVSKDGVKKDEFYNENIVEIEAPRLHGGASVLIELDGEILAGPYQVGFRELDKIFYVRPQIKENKFTIASYHISECNIQKVDSSDGYWSQTSDSCKLAWPKEGAMQHYQDVIGDSELLNSFKESLSNDSIENGRVDVSDIDKLLKHFEESVLTGTPLSKEIRGKRLNRLIEILTAERDLDETLSFVTETLCESFNDLIIKYQDSPNVEELIGTIVDRRPDLMERIQNFRIIKEQYAKQQQALEQLQQEKAQTEEELSQIKETSESVEKSALEQKTKELLEMDAMYAQQKAQLESTIVRLGLTGDIETLQSKQESLEHSIREIDIHKRFLEEGNQRLETDFSSIINNHHDRMVNIAFDGFMSNAMLKAAAQWETEEIEQRYAAAVEAVNAIEIADKEPQELVEYLCRMVKIARPQYTPNTIVNIAICMAQSFLTVLSGEPGCGKTSICNIVADVLGLNKIQEFVSTDEELIRNLSRYIPISVERGWTSKRDFIGYFNPLSKTFDKSNRRVYDGLKILDIEKRNYVSKYPFIILLDEANLSPMEYYWADFMNVCDDLNDSSQINLGEEYMFAIPETLHFFATINNDHTTEILSPRLIDRAWVITLPQFPSVTIGSEVPKEDIEIISWESIRKTFLSSNEAVSSMSAETQQIYETKIIPHLRKAHIFISPRTDIAIKKYWIVASERFDKDEYGNDASIVALDYAVAQKVLPRIVGNGDEFAKWLEELRNICNNNYLNISATLLKDMISRGKTQMGYYQFFS